MCISCLLMGSQKGLDQHVVGSRDSNSPIWALVMSQQNKEFWLHARLLQHTRAAMVPAQADCHMWILTRAHGLQVSGPVNTHSACVRVRDEHDHQACNNYNKQEPSLKLGSACQCTLLSLAVDQAASAEECSA